MPACEKCWGDAYLRHLVTGKPQDECYRDILKERTNSPCSPREQAGQFWDKEKQRDRRRSKY